VLITTEWSKFTSKNCIQSADQQPAVSFKKHLTSCDIIVYDITLTIINYLLFKLPLLCTTTRRIYIFPYISTYIYIYIYIKYTYICIYIVHLNRLSISERHVRRPERTSKHSKIMTEMTEQLKIGRALVKSAKYAQVYIYKYTYIYTYIYIYIYV
jgi:hypothetical protein